MDDVGPPLTEDAAQFQEGGDIGGLEQRTVTALGSLAQVIRVVVTPGSSGENTGADPALAKPPPESVDSPLRATFEGTVIVDDQDFQADCPHSGWTVAKRRLSSDSSPAAIANWDA